MTQRCRKKIVIQKYTMKNLISKLSNLLNCSDASYEKLLAKDKKNAHSIYKITPKSSKPCRERE